MGTGLELIQVPLERRGTRLVPFLSLLISSLFYLSLNFSLHFASFPFFILFYLFLALLFSIIIIIIQAMGCTNAKIIAEF
jgi:hypothetical protein